MVRTDDWWGTPFDQRFLIIFTPTGDPGAINAVGCVTYFSLQNPNQKAVLRPDPALE